MGKGEDDDDVETGVLLGRALVEEDSQDDTEKEKKATLRQKLQQRLYEQTLHCIFSLSVLGVVIGGCVVSFFYCKTCLLGIIILSCVLCPWMPYLNIPLWISILMLVILGWHFTNGDFIFSWH